MSKRISKPGKIHLQIVAVLKRFPQGATGGTIRQELEKEGLRPEDQTHLDRRKRDLKKWFVIKKMKGFQEVDGKKRIVIFYKYIGERTRILDEGQISQRVRAEVIHAAWTMLRSNRLNPRGRHLFKSLQKRLDLGLGKALAVGVEFRQQRWKRLREEGENLFKFWKFATK